MRPILTGIMRVTAAATLVTVPIVVTATPAAAEPILPIVAGDLDWGIKESFRNYVTGPIGHGEITVSDGAVQHDDGTFGFGDGNGNGEYDLGGHNLSAAFTGSVNFSAHDGALELTVGQPRVTTDNATKTGAVVVDLWSKDLASGETTFYDDVTLADLDLTGVVPENADGYTALADIPAVLTAEGAEAFAGFYGEGTALDPVTVSVKADAGSDSEPDGSIVGGHLDWGVKESFRNYVVGPIANGSVELSGGATDNGNGYRFTVGDGDYDPATGEVSVSFDGAVRFLGHEHDGAHELDLRFEEFVFEVTGGSAALHANGVAIADVTLPEGGLTVTDDVISLVEAPATLTAEGETYFEGFYRAGDALDPVTVQLALSDEAQIPGGTPPGGSDDDGAGPNVSGGRLPVTGSPLTLPISIGAVLLLTGAVALWWSRRRSVRLT
ncbi:Htaa protein [Stackebrandtia endophytica]|uniref:Htaa protein n=1 Tax=Stackebrandtia endophytica TaxID=1496996 RepID=A0A543ATY7_9ACTN|nr:HtaA domain-containing protein [Stackebrandtia endophytica]TQL76042.1 Htaa protein [Stackebrandtia endophytica]